MTYQAIAEMMGLPLTGNYMASETGQLLGEISDDERGQGRPMLSALVVGSGGLPGRGFFNWRGASESCEMILKKANAASGKKRNKLCIKPGKESTKPKLKVRGVDSVPLSCMYQSLSVEYRW